MSAGRSQQSCGWHLKAGSPEPDRILTSYHDDGAPAWLATIKGL
jgi:hypothetical protein